MPPVAINVLTLRRCTRGLNSAPATPLTKVPEPVVPATNPTPADGANAQDPTQLRKELEQTHADLDAARAEIATLRATISRLESAPGSKPSAPPASAQKP